MEVNDSGGSTSPDDDSGNPILFSTVTVAAVDDAATAGNDTNSVTETGAITDATVFGNDSDADGPALQIVEVNGSAANVGTQIQLGSGALLTLNADGSYDYDPNDRFRYLISATKAADTGAVNTAPPRASPTPC